jgi:HAD superfamily hydrolase (TIGR01484 family)
VKNFKEFKSSIRFLLTDIDDTLTDQGLLGPEAYEALWKLSSAGILVIPVTGRPAGWCEMIARAWPVAAVIGENGGFYFRYNHQTKKMTRYFIFDERTQARNRIRLNQIQEEILKSIPGTAIASDQFSRLMDLAVDFCEDVPRLPEMEVDKIVDIFKRHGAQAKISSIHVNGWFGDYNKVTTSLALLNNEFGISEKVALKDCAFVGDSPNDEPMFEKFPHSFAVANLSQFLGKISKHPTYIANERGGLGFAQIAAQIITTKI